MGYTIEDAGFRNHGAVHDEIGATYEQVVSRLEKLLADAGYPDAVIGHDGDISDGGDRTLAWASEDDAEDDDGARAIAVIRADREEPEA